MPPRRVSQPQTDRYALRQRRGARVVPEVDERQTGEKAIVRSTVRSRVTRSPGGSQATRATKAPQRVTHATGPQQCIRQPSNLKSVPEKRYSHHLLVPRHK